MTQDQIKDILTKHSEWLENPGRGARADLNDKNIQGANLLDANLRGANLRGANLRDANLRGANLRGANLVDANIQGANLWWASLVDANLRGANLPHFQIVPTEGAFVAYKRVRDGVLVLEVPADAKRTSSLVGRQCRASKVKVLREVSGGVGPWCSLHDSRFQYRLGEEAVALDYSDDIRVECAPGIHFFMTVEEAQEY